MTTEPNRPTEQGDVRPRCRCGRELRDPAAGEGAPTCIACGQPAETCACGPTD